MQAMQYVIVPQALRAAMPALISRAILQFKNTSLAMAVGVGELSYQALDLENETYRTFATFGASSIFYVAGSSLIILIGGRIAARYSAGK
jgi:polar amino acid transport system permease protein